MRRVDPEIYTKEYYLNCCQGIDENTGSSRFGRLLSELKIVRGMKILDLGCGRGDLAFYLAKRGAEVVGVDYSGDAIGLAKNKLSKKEEELKSKIKFVQIDANKLDFPEDFFDAVVSIDVFEHLYSEELERVMRNISRILKKNGQLLVHTEANKIYLDYFHKYYIYPVSSFLILLNKTVTGKKYPGLPKDPRNELHKVQHVNEPTYFYLKKLFKRHKFKGKVVPLVSLLKPLYGWKDLVYNMFVLLYPISLYPPIIYLFAYDFVCIMKNKK